MVAFQGRLYVVKIGSGCLFNNDHVDDSLIRQKAQEIEQLEAAKGYRFILVVSGAIALGKRLTGETRENKELSNRELQKYAMLGQPELIQMYRNAFVNRHVGQILLHKHELSYRNGLSSLFSRNGLFANRVNGISGLVNNGHLPAINYADDSDDSEVRKDNDQLAARVLQGCNARMLVILGNGYDGFCDANGRVIRHVNSVDKEHYALCKGTSKDGAGGFETKLDAAKIVLSTGKEMVIGNIAYSLEALIDGTATRTLFRRD